MANVTCARLAEDLRLPMSKIIVSYDGTPNDDDALALARLLAPSGAGIALAYVRHARELDPERERIAQHDAERRLEQGAAWLNDPAMPRHVVLSASTGEGLAELAAAEGASLIVFGSDYRTPPGRVEPGTTAQHLLEGGTIPIAVAPAGLRTRAGSTIEAIALSDLDAVAEARETAERLAEQLGASVIAANGTRADLIIASSQPAGAAGRIALGGATRAQLDGARGAVIVLPRGIAALL